MLSFCDLEEEEAAALAISLGVGEREMLWLPPRAEEEEPPGWKRCSCTEASLLSVTRVPVSFLHLFQALSSLSDDLLRNSPMRPASPEPFLSTEEEEDTRKFASRVGKACLSWVTDLLHWLSTTAIDSTSWMRILFFLLMTPLRTSSTLVSSSAMLASSSASSLENASSSWAILQCSRFSADDMRPFCEENEMQASLSLR